MATNTKPYKLPYLTYIKGKPHFQRRYPKSMEAALKAAGRSVIYKKALAVTPDASIPDVAAAIEKEKAAFNEYLEIINAGCVKELEELELRRKALVWLEHHGLTPGQFYRPPGEPMEPAAADHFSGTFTELFEYEYFREPERAALMAPHQPPDRSLLVAVQEMAFKLITEEPPNRRQTTLTFSAAWTLYTSEKDTGSREKRKIRALKKDQARWDEFIKVAGNRVVTQENVTEGLRRYHQHLRDAKSLTTESRRRYMTPVKSALNRLVDEYGLPIIVKAPRLRRTDPNAGENQRYTFSLAEQIQVLQLFSNPETDFYAPWKELYVTLMMQTGAIASELQRMPLDNLNFDGVPNIYFDGELKGGDRRRVVPLVVRPDRIRELAIETQDGSGLLLGADVSSWDESRISREFSDPVKQVNAEAVPYSLRHSFRYAMDMADIPIEVQAKFGGWHNNNINRNHARYGRSGDEHQERLKHLATICTKAFRHLIDERLPRAALPPTGDKSAQM